MSGLKRKTAMVLHQIEESLGNFVLKNGNIESLNQDALSNIYKREVDRGKSFEVGSIKDVVEATYLNELFSFAIEITKDTSLSDSVSYLYSLFHDLDIYEVRNTVSHPNRPFWDCYWYRVAAIASDPVNEILGLVDVKKALISAEQGTILDPPDEWLSKIIWQIPNNLPQQFEHGVTGLIGRAKETQELREFIENPRISTIALVAPGGIGKTAIALDLLDNLVSTPAYSQYVDAVIFVTMKTEKLTPEGVVSLDAIETIDQLKSSIVEGINGIFEEESTTEFVGAISIYKSRKILLCIDNLETLLRDNPDAFESFNISLPPLWKVLVTSRMSISNATVLSVGALKEKQASHLARLYITKRGGEALSEDTYSKLSNACHFNPLAIRLTLDLVLSGKDLPESLNTANKEIAEFSYNNLIEVLSDNAVNILETIFVEDISTRISLCDLLNISLDDVSAAVAELSRTSLISRISGTQGETYQLSNSVRDLLLLSPRNINARTNVQNLINKRRALSKELDLKQREKELPTWHIDYVPVETNENLKILVTECNRKIRTAYRNADQAVALYRKLNNSRFIYEKSSLYNRTFARVLEILKDAASAEKHYKIAIDLDKTDATNKYLMSRFLHNQKRYDEAAKIYESLMDEGWTDEERGCIDFGKSVYNGYFLALLYSGNYQVVLDKTKKWKESKNYRGVIGTYRATAWKRSMENLVDEDIAGSIKALISASRILNDVFKTEGYFDVACNQAIKIFEEIDFCFSRSLYCDRHPNEGIELLEFIANNILETKSIRAGVRENLIEALSKIPLDGNPFKSNKWNAYLKLGLPHIQRSDTEAENNIGLIKIFISNRPKDKVSFLFGIDQSENNYFMHFDNLKDGTWAEWCKLSIGMAVFVVPSIERIPGKAIPVSEIYIKSV